MDINLLVNISARAWAIPILAQLHAGVAGRQAPLLAATGASRTAFSQSMGHLIDLGLLERNPGHGHPLRPEFRLTALGIAAAKIAHNVHKTTSPDDRVLLRRSWTLPILATLHRPRPFGEIRQTLGPITDRALSQSLRSMEAHDWVDRRVDETSRPPKPMYCAINRGTEINQVLQRNG